MAHPAHQARRETTSWTVSPWIIGLLAGLTAAAGGIVLAFGGPLAAAALIVVGVAAFVVLRDIEMGFWGVIGVITLLPFATLPVDIGITPTFLDVALAAVVGVWALQLVSGRRRTIVTAPVTVPLLVFIVIAVFAFIFGLSHGPLTPTLLRHFAELLLSLGFVLVVVDYATTTRRLARLVTVLLLASAAAALLGIALWILPEDSANTALNALQRLGYPGGWVIRYIEENPALSERAIGTSVDPNSFGGLLLIAGSLAGPQFVARRPLFHRWLVMLITGVIFIALILTFSRGAMVGLMAGLGFVALARYRRLLPYLLGLGVLFLLLPVTQGYVARFVAGLRGEDLATQMRFGEYIDAITLILRYPLFGVGFAGSPDIDLYLGVANVYLTIAQEMGFLGLAAFFAVIGTVFGYAFFNRHRVRTDPDLDPLWLGLHAALIGGLVAGIFDHYLFNINFHHAVTLFWMLIGMATAATRLGAGAKRPPAFD
jgi:polysaccharide biosynthesis protein PslJ